MAAFLLLPLPSGTDLTLGDIEAWLKRARALGATDESPVTLGEPPAAAHQPGTTTLSVPVNVTRTVLPTG
jgi:hypothetical protein